MLIMMRIQNYSVVFSHSCASSCKEEETLLYPQYYINLTFILYYMKLEVRGYNSTIFGYYRHPAK
jgi:hypothetical protein